MKLKVWYKDGKFPEQGKGYEEFEVKSEHRHHDRITLLNTDSEIVVDKKLDEDASQIRSIKTQNILQAKLVADDQSEEGENQNEKGA